MFRDGRTEQSADRQLASTARSWVHSGFESEQCGWLRLRDEQRCHHLQLPGGPKLQKHATVGAPSRGRLPAWSGRLVLKLCLREVEFEPAVVLSANPRRRRENVRHGTCKLSFLCHYRLLLRKAKMNLIVKAVAIFVVSVAVLLIFAMLTSGGRATGIAVLKLYGITFMYVGALYFLAGLLMRFTIR